MTASRNLVEPIMKTKILALATSALLSIAAPAFAQTVTGTTVVQGFVAPRCGATLAGDSTFNGTINLGELTQTNGTLSSTLAGSGTNSVAGQADFLVGCTGGGQTVTLSATRLSNTLAPNLPTSSNDIDFTAQAKIALAVGGFATVDYTTAAALPAPTAQTIPGVFANVPGNFQIRIFGLSAENGASSLLVAGNYTSTITVLVAPAT